MSSATDRLEGGPRQAGACAAVTSARVSLVGAVLAVGLVLLGVWFATAFMPWLGVELAAAPRSAGGVVTEVHQGGPAEGRLQAGDVIVALRSEGLPEVPLGDSTVTRASYSIRSYEDFNRFFGHHATVFQAIARPEVSAVLADGSERALRPAAWRPASTLPLDFWAMNLLAAVALLIGVGVLAYRPRELSARMFFLACLGAMLTAAMMALGKSRELTFHPEWVQLLWRLDQFGKNLAFFGLVALFWVYPRRFRSPWLLAPVAALYLLAWVADALQWWPSPNTSAPLVMTASVLLALAPLAVWQWRATRADLVGRATVKILLVALFVPCLVIVAVNRMPMLLGFQPLVSSGVGLAALVLTIYVGVAVGVARYRLFDLDRWWFETLLCGLATALVVMVDLLLLTLHVSGQVALGAALVVVCWLYLAVRGRLWQWLRPRAAPPLETLMPRVVDTILSARSADALKDSWRQLLSTVYLPLSMEVGPDAGPELTEPTVADEGLRLRVPALAGGASLELLLAGRGQRLFDASDVRLAAGLLVLMRQAAQVREAIDRHELQREAHLREREWMAQDLHDGLGGMVTSIRLLALQAGQEAQQPALHGRLTTIAELAGDSLAELRHFMDGLDEPEASWSTLFADQRAHGRRLTEPHGIAFEWSAHATAGVSPPSRALRLNLIRILREALTNVVKHAQARRVQATIEVGTDGVLFTIADDGVGIAPEAPGAPAATSGSPARGLRSLQSRARRLGGRMELHTGAGTRLVVHLPWAHEPAPIAGAARTPPGPGGDEVRFQTRRP